MRCLRFIVFLIAVVAGDTLAGSLPQEPEKDNPEYLLDVVTNDWGRAWRESWDAGDNRFRFRLGSNKVAQWFIEEELKLSAPIADRVRFRFYHARLFRYTTEEIPWDVVEFEGRLHRNVFLSLYARPAFDKRESSLGVMLQLRQTVNRYVKLSAEWPGFMRNFSEHKRETSDSLLNIFTDQPIRFGLDLREEITPHVWIRAVGEVIPRFGMGEEVTQTGEQVERERAEGEGIGGWLEYIADPSRDVRSQRAFGVQADYQRSRKSKDATRVFPVYGGNGLSTGGWGGDAGGRVGGSSLSTNGRSGDTGSSAAARRGDTLHATPQLRFDEDLYEPTDDDTVSAWRETRAFVSPYAWVPLGDRVVVNATLRFEEREIAVGNSAGQTFHTTNEYVVPRLGVSYAFGSRREFVLEGGWVSEWRTRTVEEAPALGPAIKLDEDSFDDHRVYLAFEYVFGESNMIRLNEGFELDCEDRGQFGIHDHGFFQMILGF